MGKIDGLVMHLVSEETHADVHSQAGYQYALSSTPGVPTTAHLVPIAVLAN